MRPAGPLQILKGLHILLVLLFALVTLQLLPYFAQEVRATSTLANCAAYKRGFVEASIDAKVLRAKQENTKDILVIYEQEAEEWALYLKSLFGHIVNEGGILLYNLETSSFKHQELFCLPSYKCKLLILSCGLLNCLNQERCCFLEQVLKPLDNVVILLCGVKNSKILYEILTLDGGSKEISTDQKPEEYISVVTGIIQQGIASENECTLSKFADDQAAQRSCGCSILGSVQGQVSHWIKILDTLCPTSMKQFLQTVSALKMFVDIKKPFWLIIQMLNKLTPLFLLFMSLMFKKLDSKIASG
ncbi:hypothetical protein WISP_85320 [Willisornis vidua]|uniref:PIK3AP1 Toll/interleukin-1 receptor domain-containing protein n=1 Tax=Willisornis vidua TaxID=1566151 RepID=A0ABQ9D3A1_9PASS|nr:hypothetical protein WISP_85320 [Willisornis vidua]